MDSILDLIKGKLKELRVEESRLESISTDNLMVEFLTNPFSVSAFFHEIGIPLINYGFNPNSVPIGRDFMFRNISEEGYNRILEAGRLAGDEKRALELAEAGKRSMTHLYTKLNVGDVINLCSYEQSKGRLLAA